MKHKFLITLFLLNLAFAQNINQAKKTTAKKLEPASLKCGTLKGEQLVNSYFSLLRSYYKQVKEKKFTKEQVKQIEERLYQSFLFIPGLDYRTISEKANIYLIKLTPKNEKGDKQEDGKNQKDSKNKGYERVLIKTLNSPSEIQELQLKRQEGNLLNKQISNLKSNPEKKEELQKLEKKLSIYQEEMTKKYNIQSKLTYQISVTELSIYLLLNYNDLLKIKEFKKQQ